MKKLISILIILSFVACSPKNEKKDILIETFENNLGKNETNHLNEIVEDFDKYLAANYPDQELKFRAYLSDISELNFNKYWKIDSTKLEKYKNSKLFRKYETIFPDSVWCDGKNIYIQYPDSETLIEIIPIQEKNKSIDSLILSFKNEPEYMLREESQFYLAINSIQESDSLIMTYLEVKETAGRLTPSTLAGGLMYYLTEENEYFAKRIFILELFGQ